MKQRYRSRSGIIVVVVLAPWPSDPNDCSAAQQKESEKEGVKKDMMSALTMKEGIIVISVSARNDGTSRTKDAKWAVSGKEQ